jgi:hypothetical protein
VNPGRAEGSTSAPDPKERTRETMTLATPSERAQFKEAIIREYPDLPKRKLDELVNRITRAASKYSAIQEAACNRELTNQDRHKEQRAEEAIKAACAEFPKRVRVIKDDMTEAERLVDAEDRKRRGIDGPPYRVLFVDKNETGANAYDYLHAIYSGSVHNACQFEGYQLQVVGIEPVFSGDPRGATVKLRVPSGKCDDWGQTGLCIPTS